MEFLISKNALQKELGFVQGIVEKKNTIHSLSNILIESIGDKNIRLIGTDLDMTLRCECEAEITTHGSICVGARKLFEIIRMLPDAPINFRKDDNNWVSINCERSSFRVAGMDKESFPDVPVFKSAPVEIGGGVLKTLIDRTIFSVTSEESRYTLSGAKFLVGDNGIRMVTTDGHRLAFIEYRNIEEAMRDELDVLIPRKTLTELSKLITSNEDEVGIGSDDNHIHFEVGERLLISRTLTGQFPNYEMVMPKANDKRVEFDPVLLSQAVRRVALMADDRSQAIRFNFSSAGLQINAQTAEEGEAQEIVPTEYVGEEVEIGFNASYLQDFLGAFVEGKVLLEFKDANSQVQLSPVEGKGFDYKYVVMPMRI